ncbi:AAA family ATPase, partial [Candidatus Parcubacteria bacterium]|nr:AAA family ATPase [Candidatus Parcubacteria bacterium]
MLKRLELSGFKSFAKKTVFELDHPVTAIVGPNGSGKSNIAEAVRFVLGEQSMKSLRGKSGTDLIFKGGKSAGALGRASVSIVFDNRKRIFQKRDSVGDINVDFDEIIVSREVYGDGENHYLVNGSQVRLKDILELLAPLNIGSSGHHIISQGEADKILNASIRERKEMVEDALGLRVYQYKIAESERKLDKTNANVKEAEALRRELAPHITFLKKQVEKIEKAKEMREELRALYLTYFARESAYLAEEGKKISHDVAARKELAELEHKLVSLKRDLSLSPKDEASNEERRSMEEELALVRNKKDELGRRLGRLEGMIELEEERAGERARETGDLGLAMVSLADVEAVSEEISAEAERALGKDATALETALRAIREKLASFVRRLRDEKAAPRTHIAEKLKEFRTERGALEKELAATDKREKELSQTIERIKNELEEAKENLRDKERAFFELSSRRSELVSAVGILSIKEEQLRNERAYFDRELAEAVVLVGEGVKQYGTPSEGEEPRAEQE